MVLIEQIIQTALDRDASDIHLLYGLKPMLRISKALLPIEEIDYLDEDDLYDIYEYIVEGSVLKDQEYKEQRRLDCSLVYKDIRLRVNVSFACDIPVCTMRIIKNDLPRYEDLGLPEMIKSMVRLPQGLILVTGKTNSGKSTTLNCLIDDLNEKENKKILTLESPIEFKHTSKRSIIVQKEVGAGKDSLSFREGVMNALREDCDILVCGEIRDKQTMEAAIDMAESGHLVLGTLHTKSCAETLDRIVSFYDVKDQAQIKNLMSALLKLVVSQRLMPRKDGKGVVLVPEIMVVDNAVAACIRKEKFSVSEVEDAIQGALDKGSIGLMNSLAKLYIEEKLSLEQVRSQIDEKNYATLDRIIMQYKGKRN
jgi:twitching motility protein PilT